MPVIVVMCRHVKRLRMQKVIICDSASRTFDTTDYLPRQPRKLAKLASFHIFKSRLMPAGQNPDFEAKSTGIGTQRDEMLRLHDDSFMCRKFLLDHVEQKRPFVPFEVLAAGGQLLLHHGWHIGQSHKLAVNVFERRARRWPDV